jgi:hypothetical protein
VKYEIAFAKEYLVLMDIYFHLNNLLKNTGSSVCKYVPFTDFKKTFDRVNRNIIFVILILVALPVIHPPVAEVILPLKNVNSGRSPIIPAKTLKNSAEQNRACFSPSHSLLKHLSGFQSSDVE